MAERTRWEYRTETISLMTDLGTLELGGTQAPAQIIQSRCDNLGAEGWELASILGPLGNPVVQVIATFKRPAVGE